MTGTVTRTEAVACDRGALSTGIVHFGVGGFHRSHQQVSFRNLQFGITRNVARTNRALARSIGRDAPNEPDIRRTGPHAKRL
jgi:hypothetical protein